jgi:hypothetical protein
MLVRYKMNSACTLADMRSDIDKIIRGLATSTSDLSAGCNSAATQFFGTYPAGKYVRVGTSGTADTYSKVHNEYSDVTHYFRLTYDSTRLTTMVLASDYTAGTDTLINSREIVKYTNKGIISGSILGQVLTTLQTNSLFAGDRTLTPGDVITTTTQSTIGTVVNPGIKIVSQLTGTAHPSAATYLLNSVNPTAPPSGSNTNFSVFAPTSANISVETYSASTYPFGIDIVVTSKFFYISNAATGTQLGVFDIGKNGVSRIFTNNMLMAGIDLGQESFGVIIPYTYRFSTNTYGPQTDVSINSVVPQKRFNSSDALIIIENPTFAFQPDNGNVVSVIYGLLKLAEGTYGSHITYADSGNVRRLTFNDYALLTE